MNDNTVKILHCADAHLDSPFAENDPDRAALRRSELRQTFARICTYVKLQKIDIMLIAGDLFDRDFVTLETVSHILRLFGDNKSCRFVISPGNHDPYTPDSVYAETIFPDNVYIFKSDQVTRFSFDELNCDVYGYAFTAPTIDRNPFAGTHPERSDRVNIMCAHGELNPVKPNKCPIKVSEILEAGYDYTALGHIHSPAELERVNGCIYGYSGCIEGRDFGECGYKGAYVAALSKSGGELNASVKKVRFSSRRYEKLSCDLTGCDTAELCYAKIFRLASEYKDDTSLRLTLTGEISPELTLSKEYLRSELEPKLFSLDTVDLTRPLCDFSALEKDPTIRGEFFRRLLPKLNDPSEEIRATASAALRMGLAALNGNSEL